MSDDEMTQSAWGCRLRGYRLYASGCRLHLCR